MGMGIPMIWEYDSHGNPMGMERVRASDGNRSENGNGDMGMGITYFVCIKNSHADV